MCIISFLSQSFMQINHSKNIIAYHVCIFWEQTLLNLFWMLFAHFYTDSALVLFKSLLYCRVLSFEQDEELMVLEKATHKKKNWKKNLIMGGKKIMEVVTVMRYPNCESPHSKKKYEDWRVERDFYQSRIVIFTYTRKEKVHLITVHFYHSSHRYLITLLLHFLASVDKLIGLIHSNCSDNRTAAIVGVS